jgi:phage terminase large subunit-like protein
MADRDYAAIAAQFEQDVESGAFLTGALFRAAVARQRRDVESPPAGYVWSDEAADKACAFAEALAFPKGPKRGQRFRLEAWQVWLVRVLFGWADSVTGAARWHKATIFLSKGNGKTPLAAIIALNVMARGKRVGAKAYCAATTQKQAREVFEGCQEMLRLSPELRDAAGLVVGEHSIRGVGDNRVLEPISSESGSAEGKVPDIVVIDEIHVHPNRKLYDNLCSAASKVDGSRVVVISTAGNDMSPEAVGYAVYGVAKDILTGAVEAPAHFALICEADRDRDPWHPDTWRQANPNLGVSVSLANFRTSADEVRGQPSSQADFFAKRLGWWSQAASAFMDVRRWNELGDPTLSLDDIDRTWQVYDGVDLARTRDLTTAVTVAARTRGDGKREYRVFTRDTYLPAESVTVKRNADFLAWARDGWMTLTPGPTMTFAPLKEAIIGRARRFPGFEVCIDDFMAIEVENELAEAGVTVVSVRQGAKTQSEPMKELEAAVLDGRLTHDANPVAAMCIANLQAAADRNGNIAPDRENEYKKIDIAVGIINALVRARLDAPQVYTADRGLFFVSLDS